MPRKHAQKTYDKVLAFCQTMGEVSAAEIAKHLGVSKVSVTTDYMIKLGLLKKRVSDLCNANRNKIVLYSLPEYDGKREVVTTPKQFLLGDVWK